MARIAAALVLVALLAAGAFARPAQPAPRNEYPILVGAIATTAIAVAQSFGQLDASIRLTALLLPPDRIRCRATIGSRALKGTSYFQPGRAGCRWAIPRGSRGKLATGSVSVTIDGKTIVKRFKQRIK